MLRTRAHSWSQILSFSYSFRQKCCEIIGWCTPIWGWHPPPSEKSWIRYRILPLIMPMLCVCDKPESIRNSSGWSSLDYIRTECTVIPGLVKHTFGNVDLILQTEIRWVQYFHQVKSRCGPPASYCGNLIKKVSSKRRGSTMGGDHMDMAYLVFWHLGHFRYFKHLHLLESSIIELTKGQQSRIPALFCHCDPNNCLYFDKNIPKSSIYTYSLQLHVSKWWHCRSNSCICLFYQVKRNIPRLSFGVKNAKSTGPRTDFSNHSTSSSAIFIWRVHFLYPPPQ